MRASHHVTNRSMKVQSMMQPNNCQTPLTLEMKEVQAKAKVTACIPKSLVLLTDTPMERGSISCRDRIDARPERSNPRLAWHDRRDLHRVADSFAAFMAALAPE